MQFRKFDNDSLDLSCCGTNDRMGAEMIPSELQQL